MTKSRARSRVAAMATAVLVAACGEASTGPLESSTLRIVSGDELADTIDARPATALIAEVLSRDGSPRTGVEVVFEVVSLGDQAARVTLASIGSAFFGSTAVDTTDANGRAAAIIRFGSTAGPAEVGVSLTGTPLRSVARFTVTPGAPNDITLARRDTALYVDGSYSIDARVVDRRGNERSDVVTLVPSASNVSITGTTVRGSAIGRASVIAQSGSLRDTAWVSVVPRGAIAAYKSESVFAVNLDGSMRREIIEHAVDHGNVGSPAWAHRGDSLLFVAGSDFGGGAINTRLMLTNMSGGTRPFLTNNWSNLGPGDFSSDGMWMYFSRNECNLDHTLYRARGDGSAPEHIGPPATCFGESAQYPSPSPDGRRVVYQRGGASIAVLDVASGVVTVLDIRGRRPRWSPASDEIAYLVNGEVRIIRVDGSGMRILTPAGREYAPGVDWSPDGGWIIAHSIDDNRLELIEVATGRVLPLPFAIGMMRPAWRP